jgi:hypothetical protein
MAMARAHGGMDAIGFLQIGHHPRVAMPELPDPDPSFSADKRLWVGLSFCFTAMVVLAITVRKFVPAVTSGQGASPVKLPNSTPLMSRPQLLENQQAMPELADFDAQTPPPNLTGGTSPIQTPGPSSPLLQGGLGQ